jgi:hypothetical protein
MERLPLATTELKIFQRQAAVLINRYIFILDKNQSWQLFFATKKQRLWSGGHSLVSKIRFLEKNETVSTLFTHLE